MKPALVPFPLLELGLVLFFFSAPVIAASDNPQYRSRQWQMENGLPYNSVSAVLQTSDGYLWVGTPKGLARFDGVHFTVIGSSSSPALEKQAIRSLYQTKDGTLWIGTETNGLVTLKEGRFQICDWPRDKRIRALLEASDGSLWLATGGGLGHYQNGKCQWFTTTNGLPNDIVLSLCEDREGNIWIGTNNGLVRYKDTFQEVYRRGEGLNSNSVRALLVDRDGTLWVGTNGGGLSRRRNQMFFHFNKANGLPDDFVWTMCEDSRGQLWIGTYGGLCRRVDENFIFESNSEGVSYEMVFCIAEDREKNIWLGTKEGLDQLRQRLFTSYTKAEGMSHHNAISIREDSQGRMLIGTWGGGLNILQNGKFTVYNQTNGLDYDVLLSVCDGTDGSIWIGTDYDGGVYRLNEGGFSYWKRDQGMLDNASRVLHEDRNGNLWIGTSGALYLMREEKLLHRFTTNNGLPSGFIRAICEDAGGDLWIGTHEGLALIESEKLKLPVGEGASVANYKLPITSYTTKDGLSDDRVLAVYEDADKTIWIGTDGGGLNRIKNEKLKMRSEETGERRQEAESSRITSYTTKQGLFSDNIFEILEDDRGFLWMSCFSGVFRVKKKDLDDFDRGATPSISCVAFGKADGMSSVQCNGVAKPAGWKSRDGRLWFPTTRGVVVVDPRWEVREDASPPPVVIENIMVDKKAVSLSQEDSEKVRNRESGAAHFPTSPLSHLLIPPGRGELEFHYTALSFHTPERNRFKYKLEGVDPHWVEAGTRRVAYYNHIRSGSYTFRVMGCNSDGVWNQLGANVKFTLQPHFWQTKWFLGLMGFASIAAVAGTARYVTWKRVQHQLLRLEKQHAVEKERARIAQDMHDDLGARLTQILMLNEFALKAKCGEAEIKSHISRAAQVTQDVVRNLDAIVWAVNPQNDSLDKLALYLYEYFEMFLGPSSIRYRLDVPRDLPPWPMPSEMRHNIFLVVKEALNNVVKHAEATEVRLRLRLETRGQPGIASETPDLNRQGTLIISIEDNGKGLSVAAESAFSSGMVNMKNRIEKIGGSFELKSEPGAGTTIRMAIGI